MKRKEQRTNRSDRRPRLSGETNRPCRFGPFIGQAGAPAPRDKGTERRAPPLMPSFRGHHRGWTPEESHSTALQEPRLRSLLRGPSQGKPRDDGLEPERRAPRGCRHSEGSIEAGPRRNLIRRPCRNHVRDPSCGAPQPEPFERDGSGQALRKECLGMTGMDRSPRRLVDAVIPRAASKLNPGGISAEGSAGTRCEIPPEGPFAREASG